MSDAEPRGAGAVARVSLRAARVLAWIVLALAVAVLVVQVTLVPGWSRWSSGRFSEADAAYGRSTLDYVAGRTSAPPRHCCETLSTAERDHVDVLRDRLSWWFRAWPVLAAAIAVLALVLLQRRAPRSVARTAPPGAGRRARRGAGPALAVAFAALGAVGFALVVFPRLFTAFHAVVLPDALRRVPTGSATARVVPQSFFEWYALRASLIWSVVFVVCWQVIRLLTRLRGRRGAPVPEVPAEG